MSQDQGRALSGGMMLAESDESMPNDASLLLAQKKRQIADRRREFASRSLVHPDFVDEVTVVSRIGRRTK